MKRINLYTSDEAKQDVIDGKKDRTRGVNQKMEIGRQGTRCH